MSRHALFYEQHAEASLLKDASLLPGDPEDGLNELFLADLVIAGPASEEDSTGRVLSVVPTVTDCAYLHGAFGGGCPHCYIPPVTFSALNWAHMLGSTER